MRDTAHRFSWPRNFSASTDGIPPLLLACTSDQTRDVLVRGMPFLRAYDLPLTEHKHLRTREMHGCSALRL